MDDNSNGSAFMSTSRASSIGTDVLMLPPTSRPNPSNDKPQLTPDAASWVDLNRRSITLGLSMNAKSVQIIKNEVTTAFKENKRIVIQKSLMRDQQEKH